MKIKKKNRTKTKRKGKSTKANKERQKKKKKKIMIQGSRKQSFFFSFCIFYWIINYVCIQGKKEWRV